MKNKIILLTLLLFPNLCHVAAQKVSNQFLSVGKIWVWDGINRHDIVPVYFTVAGTEETDGKICYRIEQTSDIPELSGGSWLLCEDGGKVSVRYVDPDDNASWLPLFDFSMTVGEEHPIGIVDENGVYEPRSGNSWKVTEEDNVHVNGMTRRRMNLVQTKFDCNTVWVEGIGVPYFEGQLTWFGFPKPDNGIYLGGFRECIEDGETVFTFADFGDPGAVEGIADDMNFGNADDATYDVLGRRVRSTVPGSVYIRGGKKFVAK